jgi:hypothetical protein
MSTNAAQPEYSIFSARAKPPREGTTVRGVGQDNGAANRARRYVNQPDADETMLRAQRMDTHTNRSQKRSFAPRTVKVTLWVHPSLKAEVERLAEIEQLSISKVGGSLLEGAIRNSIHTQYGSLIEPIVEQAIKQQMRGISTRLALLLVRVAFDTGQTRQLVTNILARQPGVTPNLLREILDGSSTGAKRSIKTRTPQLSALIEEVEAWLDEQEVSRGKKDKPL